jgi:hypothetical protein
MTTEDSLPHDQEDITEEHSFDELAKGLSNGTLSRGKALKLLGATLFGSVLMPLFPEQAQALTNTERRRCTMQGGTVCSSGTRASEVCCPSGETCVNGACCPSTQACGSACCQSDQSCVNGACCPSTQACGSACCQSDQSCVNGTCSTPESPPPPPGVECTVNSMSGSWTETCTPEFPVCCPNFGCVPSGTVCCTEVPPEQEGAHYCFDPYQCCYGQCIQSDEVCCPNAVNGVCPPGTQCCTTGGGCC